MLSRYSNLPPSTFRLCDKLEEILPVPSTGDRIPESVNKFENYDFVIDRTKTEQGSRAMHEIVSESVVYDYGANTVVRSSSLNNPGIASSKNPISVSSIPTDSSPERIKIILIESCTAKPIDQGVRMVDRKPKNIQRQKSDTITVSNSTPDRCFSGWLGSSLSGGQNRRAVVRRGAGSSHQPFRVVSNKVGNTSGLKEVSG